MQMNKGGRTTGTMLVTVETRLSLSGTPCPTSKVGLWGPRSFGPRPGPSNPRLQTGVRRRKSISDPTPCIVASSTVHTPTTLLTLHQTQEILNWKTFSV